MGGFEMIKTASSLCHGLIKNSDNRHTADVDIMIEDSIEESEEAVEIDCASTDSVYMEDASLPPTVTNHVGMDAVHLDMVDHFSLQRPSSTIRFRTKTIQVYETANDQLQLEHCVVEADAQPRLRVTMRRQRLGSIGLRALRTIYTLVALLLLGCLLVFAAQLIAFQCMEIPQHLSGTADLRYDVLVATILSLPLLIYSMASLMVLATVFVGDCWNGHVLYALLVPLNRVAVEWFCFAMYIGVPTIAMIVCLFWKLDNWQEISALVWYGSMNVSFLIFCALVFHHEVRLCLQLAKIQNPQLSGGALVQRAILVSLQQSSCAIREHNYLVQQDTDGVLDLATLEPISTSMTPLSRIRSMSLCGIFYEKVVPPQRRFTVEEMRESLPYVTNTSWSLERLCCKLRNGRSQFVVRGPNALSRYQYQSTVVCNALGFVLATLLVVALAYQRGQGVAMLVAIAVAVVLIVGLPLWVSARQLHRAMPTDLDVALRESTAGAFHQAWAAFTVARPKEWVCWSRFALGVVVFFLGPTIVLYCAGFPKNATLFCGTGFFSGVRLSLDASSIWSEHGSLSDVEFGDETHDKQLSDAERKAKVMVARARASEVIGKITSSTRIWLWMIFYFLIGSYFVWSAVTSQNGEDWQPQAERPPIVLLNDFYYPPQPGISYTTCQLNKAWAIPGQDVTYMMDYNVLAALSYETTNVTDLILDQWFQGKDEWIDETQFVTQWKLDTGHEDSPVSFKLFSKTSMPGVGVLSIRGTETPTDRMLNAQLYMGTFLISFVRKLIPFSFLWESIYDDLVATTSWVMSDQLREASYYIETTQFANDLLRNNYTFEGKSFYFLRTTGVSLGGGLALITGAQSDAYGFAISGINPVLGRLTFVPPISMEELNTKVLNVIPENDLVSNIGVKVRSHETVACRTWPAKRQNCHSYLRIWCESLYSCGSPPDRPGVLCQCVDTWGYPEPIATGNRSFADACYEQETLFNETVGMGHVEVFSN